MYPIVGKMLLRNEGNRKTAKPPVLIYKYQNIYHLLPSGQAYNINMIFNVMEKSFHWEKKKYV